MKDTRIANDIPDRSGPGLPTAALSTDQLQGGSDKLVTGIEKIKFVSEQTTIGTWNVRTLYQSGKVKELEHELSRYKWDIIGLCEMRWTGFGETSTESGNKIWHSGQERLHEHGVGFIVRKEITGCIISCTPISCRVMSMRVSARPMNITIIQVYAPPSDHSDQEVEEFYEDLEETIKSTPKKDYLVIQGDFNAKIGPDACNDFPGTVGQFGVGDTNDRGLRLLEFACTYKLTIANTLYPHKDSRRTTWHSPDGKTHNQIDFILTPKRFKSSINKAKTRTYPGADIGSDHDMVLLNLKMRLKKKKQSTNTRIRFDLEKLLDPNIEKAFQARLGGRFAALAVLNDDINDLTNNLKETIQETAEEVLGRHRKKHQPWVNNEILELCDERRTLKKDKHKSEEANTLYRNANNRVRKRMREAKEMWINAQCQTIDKGMTHGNSKKAFSTIKTLTKSQHSKSSVIEDNSGELLTESTAVLKRWTEYCQDLYNYEIQPDKSLLEKEATMTRMPSPLPILRGEVEEAIRTLPTGKSPGADNIPAELLKHGGEELTNYITNICQKIWERKEWPKEWTQSLIIPLPKKGNSRQCQNHRTISLISHTSKIMLRIILNRLKREAEQHLAEEQAGFRAKRSTVEQIFNCRILMEKHLQHQRDLFHNFIDFKKAFDRVWHEGLWQVLRDFGIEEGLILALEALYKTSRSAVLLNNEIGEYFETTVGVRQGCLLSPVLFNLFLENIMRETLSDFQSTISLGGRTINNLRFADDIDLIAGSEEELQDLTNRLSMRAKAYGMEVSTEKSKILVNSAKNTTTQIYMNGEQLEEVQAFKYLGATLTKDGKSTTEVKTRIAMATASLAKLGKIWRSRDISTKTKIRLLKSLIQSILLYGCESWTLTAESTKRIQSFDNKCYRRILGISWKDRRTNEYVQDCITSIAGPQEPLLNIVKRRKLAWFGHVTRHDTLTKTVLQGTLEGGRKRGRQTKCWMDNIKEWTRMDSPTLIRKAENRDDWRRLTAKSSLMSPLRSFRSGD